jgi:hypothetical protein
MPPVIISKLKTKHASNEETKSRVGRVVELIVRGVGRPEILQYSEKTWGVCERQTDIYIRDAKDALAAYYNGIKRDVEIGKSARRLELCFRKLLESNQHAEAANVQKHINKLLGLDA